MQIPSQVNFSSCESSYAPDPQVRVAHLVSHPIQYFAPLYRELSTRPEIDLTVYFYSDETLRRFSDPGFGEAIQWDTPLIEGYRARFCPSASRIRINSGFFHAPNWDLIREVFASRYDIVWVHSHAHPNAWLIAGCTALSRTKLVIRQEQTLLDRVPWHKRVIKQIVVRTLFSQAYGLYIGENNRRYYEKYGMPSNRLFPARYGVDNTFFSERAEKLASKKGEIRRALGIDSEAPVILFSGKFTQKKQPLLLARAFELVRKEMPCWLLMVGNGPLRKVVEAFVRERSIPNVVMPGFMNQTELPQAYAAADLFVLPSAFQETWGLVVNEAMNFSLPVVVSDKVGCATDLVKEGWNGFVVPHDDPGSLAKALRTLVADEGVRRAFGEYSRKRVASYSVEKCADDIVAACLAVSGRAKTQGRDEAA